MYEEYYNENYTGEKYPISIYHDKEELKVIPGIGVLRVDAPQKVTGQAKYSNDIVLPHQTYLMFKRCPYAHAKVLSVDTSAAKALPGVIAVYTHDDVPDLNARPPIGFVLMEECWIQGDEVAAVVAEEEDIAEEALGLLDVEYDVLPFVLYPEEAMKPGAYIVRGDTNEVGEPQTHTRGNLDAGFAEADETVIDEYESEDNYGGTVSRSHADIETEVITATWQDNRIVAWAAGQNSFSLAKAIATQLDLPFTRCQIRPTYMGAGFGNKGQIGKGHIMASYAAMMLNRPVKFRAGCEGQFCASRQQATQNHNLKVGVKSDGTLTAIHDVNIANGGLYSGRAARSGQSIIRRVFKCPNLYTEARDFTTNNNTAGSPRCVHHPRSAMPFMMHFDKVAEAVDMNPADFLLKNAFTGSRLGTDQDNPEYDIGSNPMPGVLEKVIEVSGWRTKWKGWKTPMAVNGAKKRGIGIAMCQCSHGSLSNPMSAMIKANPDGTFQVAAGSKDHGQGFRTVGALMAAEELGVPAADVEQSMIDTDITAESVSASGSRATRNTGTAILLAARDVKVQLFKIAIAAGLIDADDPEDLETADGNVYLKANPETKVSIKDVCGKMQRQYVSDTEGGQIIGRGSHATKGSQSMQWTANVSEVEVDSDTGEVEVLNMWTVHANGRTIWYAGAYNQSLGGLTESMGRGLFEGVVRDNNTGIALSPNYLEYRIPTHMDIPNMDITFIDEIDPYGPFGAKGMGEPVVLAPAPAVANAIYNAVGARVNNTPVSPDKILAAMGKA